MNREIHVRDLWGPGAEMPLATRQHRLFSHITMNWRGRPLTSHEVIVNSIAATTTHTGLRVHAELDTAAYPAGAKVSDTQIDCLPLDRHDWHGDWNYTLRPEPPAPPPPPPEPSRAPERADWAHPAMTGMSTTAWDELTASLTVPHRIQRDNELFARRGGPPTRRPAGGHPPALTLAEQTLVTVLRLRFRTPQPVLAELFGVSIGPITKAEREIRPLLDQGGHTVAPDPTRLATLADLTAHAQAHGIDLTPKPKPAC